MSFGQSVVRGRGSGKERGRTSWGEGQKAEGGVGWVGGQRVGESVGWRSGVGQVEILLTFWTGCGREG